MGHLLGIIRKRSGLTVLTVNQGWGVSASDEVRPVVPQRRHVASIARDLVEGVVRYDLIIKVIGNGTVTPAPPLPTAKTPAAQPKTL